MCIQLDDAAVVAHAQAVAEDRLAPRERVGLPFQLRDGRDIVETHVADEDLGQRTHASRAAGTRDARTSGLPRPCASRWASAAGRPGDRSPPAGCAQRRSACTLPRSLPMGVSVASRFCAAMRPTASMMLRLQQRDLALQVRQALRHFLGLRVAVVGRPALEHVGDEHLLARQTDAAQHGIEQTAGAAHEGLALLVFLGARAPRPPPASCALRSPTPNTVRVRHCVQPALRAAGHFGCDGVPAVRRRARRGDAWRAAASASGVRSRQSSTPSAFRYDARRAISRQSCRALRLAPLRRAAARAANSQNSGPDSA